MNLRELRKDRKLWINFIQNLNVKKLTKEEQEANLQNKTKTDGKKKKPPFSQWLLHDKTAFKITFIIGAFGGLLVTLLLLILSLVFDYNIFFKVLFGLLLIWQGNSTYKLLKNRKHIDSSINDMAYKGKHDNKQYEIQKQAYDASKSGVPA